MLYNTVAPSLSNAAAAFALAAAFTALVPRSSAVDGSSEQFCSSFAKGGALDSTSIPLVPLIQDSASISQRSSLSIARCSSESWKRRKKVSDWNQRGVQAREFSATQRNTGTLFFLFAKIKMVSDERKYKNARFFANTCCERSKNLSR